MNGKRDISDFNRRVTFKSWRITQDSGGGSIYTQVGTFDTWAKKDNRSGSQVNNESQQQWSYDTTFMIRYNTDVKANMTLDDEYGRWLINSIEVDNEGYKEFMKLRCSITEINLIS